MQEQEIWVDAYNTPHWQVSNLGRLKRTSYVNNEGQLLPTLIHDVNSYMDMECGMQALIGEDYPKLSCVAHIILYSFKGNPMRGTIVKYKDGNKRNLALSNLEWDQPYMPQKYMKKGMILVDVSPDYDTSVFWADCKDYPSYQVSIEGQVKDKEGNILSLIEGRRHLYVKVEKKNVKVDELVATAFLKKPIGRNLYLSHKDGNFKNNTVSNLFYRKRNIKQKVKCLELGIVFDSIQQAERITPFNLDNISDSAYFNKSVQGYTWVYTDEPSNVLEQEKVYLAMHKEVEIIPIKDKDIPTLKGEVWKDSISHPGVVKISNLMRVFVHAQKRKVKIVNSQMPKVTKNKRTGNLMSRVNYLGELHPINVSSEHSMLFGKTKLIKRKSRNKSI
jgi:hypothetical protein